MNKGKRLVLHSVSVIAICIFGFLAMSSSSTTKSSVVATEEGTVVSSETATSGVVYQIPSPERKAYTSLGLVFATSTTAYDDRGREISDQEGVTIMLLREAQKLGGDDIINLRVSENVIWVESISTNTSGSSSSKTTVRTKTVTYTGSALVIKYNDNALKEKEVIRQ
jgi:hypothetical protein